MVTFTSEEERILTAYRNPASSGIGRAVRLSVQYAIGAAVFVVLCVQTANPYWSLAVFGIFVLWMIVRLIAARRIAGVIPRVIAKYEERIAELERGGERPAG